MAEGFTTTGVHGVTREFLTINDDVVTPRRHRSGGPHVVEGVHNGLHELLEVTEANFIGRDDKGEAHVPHVLIHCSTTGEAAGDGNSVFFTIFLVNFFQGILVATNNDT